VGGDRRRAAPVAAGAGDLRLWPRVVRRNGAAREVVQAATRPTTTVVVLRGAGAPIRARLLAATGRRRGAHGGVRAARPDLASAGMLAAALWRSGQHWRRVLGSYRAGDGALLHGARRGGVRIARPLG